jgi:DNA-binding NarL/FixJ family response regulator
VTTESAAVSRIARLVDGMPLAIELAAGWVGVLSCSEIASELEKDLSLLRTTLRNVPERHRDMRGVINRSWQMLAATEQQALAQLSIFRGGFGRAAARAVAGADLAVLNTLLSSSLLQQESQDRYRLHALVRQFAAEQLETDTDQCEQTRERHATYFAAWVHEQGVLLFCDSMRHMRTVFPQLRIELDDIRAAWRWALEHNVELLTPIAITTISNFHHYLGRYFEGADHLEESLPFLRAARETKPIEQALAVLLHDLGLLCIRLGQLDRARALIEESREIFRQIDRPLPPGSGTDPEIGLGLLALIAGDHATADELGESVRRRAASEGHIVNRPFGSYLVAQAALLRGDYGPAHVATLESLEETERAGDDWFRAYLLNDLGTLAALRGEHAAARHHFESAFAIREEFGDPEGMAVALVHLGKLADRTGDPVAARAQFERAIALYRDIGDRGGRAAALRGLGSTVAGAGDRAAASLHFAAALDEATEARLTPLVLAIAVDIAELAERTGRGQRPEILRLIAAHPAADRDTRLRTRPLLDASSNEGVSEQADPVELDALVAALREELAVLAETKESEVAPPVESRRGPLSEREIAVLRLIAAGCSNREIADQLYLTVSTVKWYAGEIFSKLGVRSRTQAVATAREQGLL